jgi:hypothetical protein
LIRPDEALHQTETWHECSKDIEWGVLAGCEEDPDSTGGSIYYNKVRGIPIVRDDDPVSRLVRACVVIGGGTYEPEIHVELRTTRRKAFRFAPSGLFADIRLFLEVEKSKRVVFENRWRSNDMKRENVQLMLARGTKT